MKSGSQGFIRLAIAQMKVLPVRVGYPVLESHLRCLKLPAMLSEYSQSARRCSADNAGYEKYLEELTAIEVGKRESN